MHKLYVYDFFDEFPTASTTSSMTTSTGSMTTTTTPSSTPVYYCETGWQYYEFAKACYKPGSDKVTWADAKTACEGMDSDLASIHSEEENAFLWRLYHSAPYPNPYATAEESGLWIGGYQPDPATCNYGWSDGTSFADLGVTKFYTGMPTCVMPGCVILMTDMNTMLNAVPAEGYWRDIACNSMPRGYICKKAAMMK